MAEAEKIDDFELINCLATGGTTQIWEVKKGPQTLAMKLLLEEAFKDAAAKKSLRHEATIGKSFSHPNIISIFDLVMTRKHGYFTMEYFRAPNLKSMIRGDRYGAHARCKKMMECLTQALAYIHEKGWIHKDLKPENVLINKGGEVRLIDFSLTSRPSSLIGRAVTKKKNIVIQGTRTYIAPEMIRRDRITPSVDIYSLGILLYETLLGHPPYRTANPNDLLMMHVRDKPVPPSELDDNITPELDQLINRMLAKYPKDRPESMQALFAEVRGLTFFKEDPGQVKKDREEAAKLSAAQVADDRLNSRMDAQRQELGIKAPPRPMKQQPKVTIASTEAQQAPAAQVPPQPGAPMPQVPMPAQMPMHPQMPMPGYPMYPGMPMSGYPMQPGVGYPGYPMPGMPGMPMPSLPQQQPPVAQPPIPQAPIEQQPGVPAQPPVPQAPVPQAPAAAAKLPAPSEDVPLATLDDLEIDFDA